MSCVVLVTIDSLRADHLGSYGYERDTSPVIDSMADRGLSFDAYSNSNWTRASFPSIITSTYPLEYGGFSYLSENRVTVGEAMKQGGYRTGGLHSNLWLSHDYNYDRGFDHFYDTKSDPGALSRLRTYVKQQMNHDSLFYRGLQWLYDTTEEQIGVDVGQTYRDGETITDRTIEWLSTNQGEDVFCWIHYMDVHHPYLPHDQDARDLGLDLDISEREAVKLRRKMLEQPDKLSDEELQQLLDLYDAEIRYMDRQIGRLRDAVHDQFGPEETAFVVTSDHGEEFGDHGGFSHNPSLYDEVLNVPIVVDAGDEFDVPDATGKQPETLELLDIPPTVCDLGGVDVPENYRGRSALDAVGSGVSCELYSETQSGDDYKICRRFDGWKLIWDRSTGEQELYDLRADPDERENVSGDNPTVVEEYEDAIRDHLSAVRETNEDLPTVEMDAGTEERLKDLGYLE